MAPISSLFGAEDDPQHYQISVPVQPGNSGGPLVNRSGRVVGICLERELRDQVFGYSRVPDNVSGCETFKVLRKGKGRCWGRKQGCGYGAWVRVENCQE